MTLQEALDLFAYNDWANTRLLGCCAERPPKDWTLDLGGSFPTLLAVVAHVVGGEWIWLKRCRGESPTAAPQWMTDPNPTGLQEAMTAIQVERQDFLRSLSDNDLERDVRYRLLNGTPGSLPLSTLLRHVVNHSTYHRGQIAAMLRRLGVAPPATDLMVHAAEQRRVR